MDMAGAQIAVRQTRNADRFVAWGKRGHIQTDCPVREPGDVWFAFGGTEDAAVGALAKEMGVAT
jgi:hypothetical protein